MKILNVKMLFALFALTGLGGCAMNKSQTQTDEKQSRSRLQNGPDWDKMPSEARKARQQGAGKTDTIGTK